MLEVDLHVHSHFSLCGIHSHLEMLQRAKALGMHAIAITDHGPLLGGRINTTEFERLRDPVDGIRLLKGMECNLTDTPGEIDLPHNLLKYMDVVLAGFHQNVPKGRKDSVYTSLLIAAIEKNGCIDIIAHLNDPGYPADMRAVAECARNCGCAIELNNSKTLLGRVDESATREMVAACRDTGCRIAVTSDAHGINELGCDESVAPYLKQCDVPQDLLVTRNAQSAFAFIEERRSTKV
jgi:putative hydrolase